MPARPRALVVFTATLFLGSFLMFLLEPMVARTLLPLLGGSPMVWNTCLVFFQVALLAGYAYAHAASRWLGPRGHAGSYVVLLGFAFLSLPIALGSRSIAGHWPSVWLFGTLTVSIGLPFLALSACAPSLQRWFSGRDHTAAADPYFLYAASNAGSLLALVMYPTIVEPLFALGTQRRIWTFGFVAFGTLAAACAIATLRLDRRGLALREATAMSGDGPSGRQRLRWTLLAGVPSSLLLAVTNYLSTDIAAVPLLWLGPLSIYLLTFVIAFGSRSSRWRALAARFLPLLVTALVMFMAGGVGGPLWLVVPLHLSTFALAALACHGRLAGERPKPAFLTEYYLWLAFGGMVGGLFNTFLAPRLFTATVEYPLALLAAAALARHADAGRPARTARANDLAGPLAIGLLTAAVVLAVRELGAVEQLLVPALGIPALAAFSQARRPARFTLALLALLLAASLTHDPYGDVLYRERTFFGTYRVTADDTSSTRALYHGTTLHGVEAYAGPDRSEPLTYYHRGGPFGQAYRAVPAMAGAREVAVIGLGVGSLAAYALPGQQWTFFEIDPAVERIARVPEYFSHLARCGDACRVVLGDARLSLARSGDARYGLLVLDAFSSDAIPVHLLTREALALYASRLSPGGVLAFHISNRHLALGPVVARLAADAGLSGLEQEQSVSAEAVRRGRSGSHWVVMAREAETLDALRPDPRWKRLDGRAGPVWTDDFSNILGVLKF